MVGLSLLCGVGLLLGLLIFFVELYILQVFVCVVHGSFHEIGLLVFFGKRSDVPNLNFCPVCLRSRGQFMNRGWLRLPNLWLPISGRPKLSALFDRKSLPSMGGALFKNLEAIKELGGSIVVGYFWWRYDVMTHGKWLVLLQAVCRHLRHLTKG